MVNREGMNIQSGNCKQGGWDASQASAMRFAGQAVAYVAGLSLSELWATPSNVNTILIYLLTG